ncbi:uncharacterized protein LOC131002707 [Salvia miltiorrhiza]|uniref:uncharacterized protein LOC131002707 n=1 Tax=Salvia miltiorrhiza TaxID=226208 RepID=UPI0025ACB919|nr:uncharacterized protein LOC131002707 [Salvia miltiorrhiza]XP_057785165.1 uncharacterized protein LOC131002707 [Salvia miltiorrhiza]
MAKSKKLERRSDSQHHLVSLRKLSSRCTKVCGDAHNGKKTSEKKEWEDAECSVCLEFPHNAVLLLCSSYDKGCRPYMCATSQRYSNCLEQYTKVTPDRSSKSQQLSSELSGILCPLCRGQVKGWTVVEPARRFLNAKKRACVQEGCSFVGRYKELRKHVKLEHPLARPRDVDPLHAEKWKKLENERDISDVISTIRSTMPGAIVIGDYVIERDRHGYRDYDDDLDDDDDDSTDDDLDDLMFRAPAYGEHWDTGVRAAAPDRRHRPGQRVRLLAQRMTGRLRGRGR